MAMGFSAHTTPFKPSSSSPPYFWLRHSCPCSSSTASSFTRSFWAFPKKAFFHRRQVCTLQSAKEHFLNAAVFSSSLQFNRNSSYSTMPLSENHRYDDKENHSSSHGNLGLLTNQISSEGKLICGGLTHAQRAEERKLELPGCLDSLNSANSAPENTLFNRDHSSCAGPWLKATAAVREDKKAIHGNRKKTAVDLQMPPRETIRRNVHEMLEDLQDRSAYDKFGCDPLSSKFELDNINGERTAQNTVGSGYTDDSQIDLQTPRTWHKTSSQEQSCTANNEDEGNLVLGLIPEYPASCVMPFGEPSFGGNNDNVMHNLPNCAPNPSINLNSSSKQSLRKSMQLPSNGSLQSSTGQEHMGLDTFNPRTSVQPYQFTSKGQTFHENGGVAEDHVLHIPASTTQRYRRNNLVSVNNVDGPTPNNQRQNFLPLTHVNLKNIQPNGSPSRNCSEEGEETNCKLHKYPDGDEIQACAADGKAADAVNETRIEQINAEEAKAVEQTRLRERLNRIYDNVLVVDNITVAKAIVEMLTTEYRHLIHACDTEVAKIDVKQETPVDHGEIICFSIYSGPDANFGSGKSCIWVDVLDGGGGTLLSVFAPFFEDPCIKKVWHNYSFDNHVIENYGFKVSGFHADTMHMARLWDSSRQTMGGYSLEALTGDPRIMSDGRLCPDDKLIHKVSMKAIFGRRKVKKDGSEGKVIAIPPVEELQRVERESWICYSALDSISTLNLYESLKRKLSTKDWKVDEIKKGSMFDFYVKYWRPFGELLVKMEIEGMLVDRSYLAEIEKVAKAEQQIAADRFRNWASKYCSDAKYMNVGSDAQVRQLFFGGIVNRKDPNECLPNEREFKVPNVDKVIEDGKKTPTKFRKITLHGLGCPIETETFTATGWPSVSGDALKTLAGKVSAAFDFIDEADHLQSDGDVGSPMANPAKPMNNELSERRGGAANGGPDMSAYGTAYAAFGGGSKGIEACHAIAALCEVCSIDSLISNFILPLQGSHISGKIGRIHCSLNINTETGRLSARRPNLQNQPALEKDRYKIRQAFIAAPGNSLIVADYGQLELRILAHLANCKSMLDAFKAGGDFHSRTAMNMYPYIREAVEQKHVLLEWHRQPGEDKPPVPLLKDAFASERRKAKMLNFSIAYGKTAVGLARDWKVSVKEAKETVDRWYSDRKEVLDWQEKRKEEARKYRRVHTLLGRARSFPLMAHATPSQKGHIERAAINTPVQGSAADVAMCAMLEISKNAHLKEHGWRLLLQVHDEVILEGPTESAEVAKAIVVECMSKPFYGENILRVDLSVDAKCAQNWYSAK